MVVGSLLLKLNDVGYTAEAEVDDLVIVVGYKYLSRVAGLVQGSLRVEDNWFKTKGLSTNHEKTEVVRESCQN